MNIPIIRLEVEGMRHSISVALSKHTMEMDAMIQDALASYCTPENIAHIIRSETTRALDEVIKQEISNFFYYGAGRRVVVEAVKEKLLRNLEEGTA